MTAAAVLAIGGVLRDAPNRPAEPSGAAAAAVLPSAFASGDTAAAVARLEEQVRTQPEHAEALAHLGFAYLQRFRETADPAYATKADAALERALALRPRSSLVNRGLASLALSRHEFRRALALARRARALAPGEASSLGAIADALVELGRYREAFVVIDRFARAKPGLAAYARVAYARELLGRPDAAVAAMELALDAAAGRPEPTAWAHVELGKLHFGQGRVARAGGHFRAALAAFPGYVYALDGLAHVEAARGRLARAIALARRAVDTVPLPQFVATLGDLYGVSGERARAREEYAVVGVIDRLLRANGVRTDLETALFDVDHGVRLQSALARARAAHRLRPSIQADDVLSWALARTDRCAEAHRFSERALRLGTRDASLFFHRGMIERCLGRPRTARAWFARALHANPHFSLLWAPVARRYAS